METIIMPEGEKGIDCPELKVEDLRDVLSRHESKEFTERDIQIIDTMVFHHAAGEMTVDEINAYHISPNHISKDGCPRICYHFFIPRSGKILWCNDFEIVTWSNGSSHYNRTTLNVCFQGDLTKTQPSPEQIKTAILLWEWSRVYFKYAFGTNSPRLLGHNQIKATQCPGSFLKSLIEILSSSIKPELMFTTIKAKQIALKTLNYYTGKLDGWFGPKSKSATAQFQREWMDEEDVDSIFGEETDLRMQEILSQKQVLVPVMELIKTVNKERRVTK
jgi:hypothetical protein